VPGWALPGSETHAERGNVDREEPGVDTPDDLRDRVVGKNAAMR
jgi:hypothetical protein